MSLISSSIRLLSLIKLSMRFICWSKGKKTENTHVHETHHANLSSATTDFTPKLFAFFFFILKKYLKSLFFFFRFTSTKFNTCTNKKRRTLLLQLHTDILCQPVHECTLPKQNLSWNRDQQSSKPPLILMGQYKICTHFLGWPLLPTDRFSSQLCFTIVSGGGGKGPN